MGFAQTTEYLQHPAIKPGALSSTLAGFCEHLGQARVQRTWLSGHLTSPPGPRLAADPSTCSPSLPSRCPPTTRMDTSLLSVAQRSKISPRLFCSSVLKKAPSSTLYKKVYSLWVLEGTVGQLLCFNRSCLHSFFFLMACFF